MAEKNYKFKRAATIVVPEEFFKPLRTKIKAVDESWSEIGGIVPSQVTFITGNPGAGKTTLTLAIAACISNQVPVAFVSLEMSDFQLAHQAKKIPGFGGVDVTGDFDQVETMKILREMKPGLIIVDSIQKAARKMKLPDGKPMPHDRAQYTIVEMFTAFAKETWTPVFLIGHCDKAGNYKGPSDLLHDVDSHLIVHYDKDMDMRTFTFGKNRFGGMVEENLFGITRDSVWLGTPYINTVFSDAVITPTLIAPAGPTGPNANNSAIVKICLDQLELKWDGSTARAAILAITDKLRNEDPDFANTYIGNPGRVKITFRGRALAFCHPRSGELNFGKQTFTKNSLEVGKVGYKKEQKFIKPRVTTRAQMLVWVIVHEWMHLYKDHQEHNNTFFEAVAKKYDWFQTII